MDIKLLACFGLGKGRHAKESKISGLQEKLQNVSNKGKKLAAICTPYAHPGALEGARGTANKALSKLKKIQGKMEVLKNVVVDENRAASRDKESRLRVMLEQADELGKNLDGRIKSINKSLRAHQKREALKGIPPSTDQQRAVNRRNDEVMKQRNADSESGERWSH